MGEGLSRRKLLVALYISRMGYARRSAQSGQVDY